MSINTSMDTITVNDVVYDVEREERGGKIVFTIEEFPGLEGEVGYDDCCDHDSPRDWSNVGTMAVSYPRYNLGDEDIAMIDFEIECPDCEGTGETYGPENMVGGFLVRTPDCPRCEGTGNIDLNPVDYFKKERGARVVIPLTVYEHSGITMSAGNVTFPWDTDRWDTSFVGFIFDTPEGVRQCIGENATDEEIEKCLRGEVEVYASYLEGDVSYWSVEDEETDYMESCGGYIGDSDHTVRECFENMEAAIEKRLSETVERAHWAARDTVTQ
jgi:hypothetical protein